MATYKEKLHDITTFIFDIDGVLTDGKVHLIGDDFVRTLNSKDGYAIQHAAKNGYKIYAISGGSSINVKTRLESLGFKEVILKASNKIKEYEALKIREKLSDGEILYMGDDIPDIQVLDKVHVSCAPKDAAVELLAMVDYVSPYDGGQNCVRDIIEQTLRLQKKWMNHLAHDW